MVSIRRVTPHDAARLRAIRLEALLDSPSAFGSTHAEEVVRSDSFWQARTAAASQGHASSYFLAIEGDETVGMVGGYRSDPDDRSQAELVSMWTSPAARGNGVGAKLVEALVAWARDTGAAEVGLWVTRGNDSAHRLYERCGFSETGDYQPLPSDPCKDEIRMRLT